jgi:hypothetical protein
MPLKFKINDSKSYEYLIHGQEVKINFQIPNALFTIVIYKQLHTRVWLHKSLSGSYYTAPFIKLYNYLILKNFPGFKNRIIVVPNLDYPNTYYKYNPNFIPNCILDYKIKFKTNRGEINTVANLHYPRIKFIEIGFGIRIHTKELNIKLIELEEEKKKINPIISLPVFDKAKILLKVIEPKIQLIPISIPNTNSKIILTKQQPKLEIKSSTLNTRLINLIKENKITLSNN